MAVITLTSDFGLRDTTVALAKSRFIRRVKSPLMVDISHLVEPYNLVEAAFMLRRTHEEFPPGSVHCVYVGAAPKEGIEYVCLRSGGQFFIAANNGILTSVLRDKKITGARILDIRGIDPNDVYDLFAAAAAHLLEGGKLEMLGPPLKKVKSLKVSQPVTSEFAIGGHIVYVDHLGTCVTNISRKHVEAHPNFGLRMTVETVRNRSVPKIYERKADVPPAAIAAHWDEYGMLCVVVGKSGGEHIKGSNQLLGLKVNDWVRIDFI